jgi:hypothetical protein
LPFEHFCPWREEAQELRERFATLQAQKAALERYVFGKKSERLPSVEQQLRREQAQQTEQSKQSKQDSAARAEAVLAITRKRGNLIIARPGFRDWRATARPPRQGQARFARRLQGAPVTRRAHGGRG